MVTAFIWKVTSILFICYTAFMVKKMQIAQALGISHTAVGAVLNGKAEKGRISRQTRWLVWAKARLMGYESTQLTEKKVRKSTICYVLCDRRTSSANTHYLGIMDALHVEATRDKRQVILMALSSDSSALAKCLHALEDQEPLGIILDGAVTEAAVTAVAQLGIPFVVSGATQYTHDPNCGGRVNAVGIDVAGGVGNLMQWFYQQGGGASPWV